MSGRVVVVGSVNVDLVFIVERLPAPGETVGGARFQQSGGGKGGNQAVAAARLGVPTRLVACIGDDPLGAAARDELIAAAVDTADVRTVDAATGVAVVLVNADGENSIAVAPGANWLVGPDQVERALTRIADPDRPVVVLASLEVPLPAIEQAAECAQRYGWTFILNPAPAQPLPRSLLARVDVLTPNQHELGRLGAGAAAELLEAGISAVVVTRGSAGADVYRPGQPVDHIEALPVEAVDTTGAGDCFAGVLAAGLAAGAELRVAVEIAVAAGSLATLGLGARSAVPSLAELRTVVPDAVASIPGWS